MKISNIEVFGFRNAILGMRYPKNSEHLSDSIIENNNFKIGEKDLKLLLQLSKAGKDHRKVLRMIHVQASVNMPISWWIQYDTYKVGTTANSRSRMHKMGSTFLTIDDFYFEDNLESRLYFENLIVLINKQIKIYQDNFGSEKAKKAWRFIIDILPMSYQQERMIDLNYEILLNIIKARYNEKLSLEWKYFCDSFLNNCPYLNLIYEVIK